MIAIFGAYLIIKDANWCFGDDHEFLVSTALGKIEPLSRHIGEVGRFVPLQHYDFNWLTFFAFGKTPFAHYLWVAISFIILVYFWLKTCTLICKGNLAKLPISLICFLVLLCNPQTINVFTEIIYPERFILVLLTAFIYFYLSAVDTNKKSRYILSFGIAIYLSYMKEPMSGAFCVFALTNLLFKYKKLPQYEKLFYMGLLLNFIAYLLLYYFLVYQTTSHFYNQGGRNTLSYFDNLLSVFQRQEFLIIVFILGTIRGINILFFKDFKHL